MDYQTITLKFVSESLWRVSIKNAPVNLITPTFVSEIADLVTRINKASALKVVIFESGTEHFFLNHFDLTQAAAFPGGREKPAWVDMVLALTNSPVISIASIRGRTRGGGNEFAQACDLRYASRQEAFFGQPEVATGIVPGGGGTERLPGRIGRDRALEVILGSNDYDAATAESYGLVTRAVDDTELDDFVGKFAARLCGFDKQALAKGKAMINRAILPSEADVRTAYDDYFGSLGWSGFRNRMPKLGAKLAEVGIDLELNLGRHLGEISQ